MTANIEIEVIVDPQQVYDNLWAHEQREFLLNNIADLKDEDLIEELENRGYNIHKNRYNL